MTKMAFSAGGDGGSKSPEKFGTICTRVLRQPAIAETYPIIFWTTGEV
jgi:hypothetical protein